MNHVTKDICYIGVNDHDLDLFEGQYIVPLGMAYNSYVILDEKIAVMDTVDQHFGEEWLANLQKAVFPIISLSSIWSRTIPPISASLWKSSRPQGSLPPPRLSP